MLTTINESKPRMGIFSHPFRLPRMCARRRHASEQPSAARHLASRKGRGTGDYYNVYYGSRAFISKTQMQKHLGFTYASSEPRVDSLSMIEQSSMMCCCSVSLPERMSSIFFAAV